MGGPGSDRRICSCGTQLAGDNRDGVCASCLRTREMGSAAVPPSFWADAAIQQALAQQHMGRLLRAWRTHPGHAVPISQMEAARRLHTSQGRLSHDERARSTDGWPLERLRHWATVMEVPHELLWFSSGPAVGNGPGTWASTATAPPSTRESREVTAWDDSTTIELAGDLVNEESMVDRRQFTRSLVGFMAGGLLLEDLEHWLIPAAGPVEEKRSSQIGLTEVEQLEQAAEMFRAWDHEFGGGLRRRAVVGQLGDVTTELRMFSHPQPIRLRLFTVMARLAECAAMMSWDAGDGGRAQRFYVTALRAAKEAGDRQFGANVLAAMARQLYYLDQPTDGLELVRLAQVGVGSSGDPLIRSMLATREAWGYALQGRVQAFRRTTGQAEDLFASGWADGHPTWITYFDQGELAGVTGGRLLELARSQPGLAEEAANAITQAVEVRAGTALRSSALDRLGLVEARLIQRELDAAAQLGHEAADAVEQTTSDRARVKLQEVYDLTATYTNHEPVAELRLRLGELLTASAA